MIAKLEGAVYADQYVVVVNVHAMESPLLTLLIGKSGNDRKEIIIRHHHAREIEM